jgi:hypothetical protein
MLMTWSATGKLLLIDFLKRFQLDGSKKRSLLLAMTFSKKFFLLDGKKKLEVERYWFLFGLFRILDRFFRMILDKRINQLRVQT